MQANLVKIVNLFAGPGAGKSTTAAGIFYSLKLADVKCELITEVAKDLAYENNSSRMSNQIYLLGEQYQRLHRVRNSVKYAISDSPIILGMSYRSNDFPKSFDQLCLDLFNQFDNINYFIVRTKKYQAYGRNETEDQACEHDANIKSILNNNNIPFKEIIGDRNAVNNIIADICASGIEEFCNV
jgi:hypothetical protein